MIQALPKFLAPLSLFLAFISVVSTASAAPNDKAASDLREQAVFDDYLNLRFAEAEAKLNQAIQLCEKDCSPAVKAKLYRDLGVVYIAGLKQRDAGVGMFVEAVTLDPAIQLDPDLSSEDLQAALKEARELAGASPVESGSGESGGPAQPPPASTELLPVTEYEGVFHTPPKEQLVNTPLPLYVEVHDKDWTAKVAKVKLFYRGFGMVRFKELELPKIGEQGYGVELDCKEIGNSPGKLDYYVVIIDEDGDAAADVGTEASPHTVSIKTTIEASPAPIPGSEIPASCPGPVVVAAAPPGMATTTEPVAMEDCPPDFPGCEPELPPEDEPEKPDHMKFPRHWVSLGAQVDFLLMHAAGDACGGSFTSELACFEGEQYWDPSTKGARLDLNDDGVFDDSGTTGGGFAMATKRVLVGYDYAITQNILAGVRLGFAIGGAPTLETEGPAGQPIKGEAFVPFHAEVRGAYWFGQEVLTDQLIRPFAQLSGGVAQVDAALDTEVIDETGGRDCADNTCRLPVKAWRKAGTFFGSVGGGAMIAFTPKLGLVLEGRFMQLLPASGSALGAQGGFVMGF